MRKIVGIDPDVRRVAYGVFDFDGTRWRVSAVATIERSNARGRMEENFPVNLRKLVMASREVGAAVYCEDIYLATGQGQKNVLTYKALAAVQGVLEHEFRGARVPFHLVSANAWRALVLGFTTGREALKAASVAKAAEWGHAGLSDHEADALCVAWYGVQQELERGAVV